MKKIILILAIIVLVTACSNKKISANYSINITKNDNCSDSYVVYHTVKDKKIYTQCINDIYLIDKNNKAIAKDYINNDDKYNNFIDNIEKQYIFVSSMWDGGTKLYKDSKDDNLLILICNKIEKNNNIFIGYANYNDDLYSNICDE